MGFRARCRGAAHGLVRRTRRIRRSCRRAGKRVRLPGRRLRDLPRLWPVRAFHYGLCLRLPDQSRRMMQRRGDAMAEMTTNHETIRKWAEKKGGKPAAVARTHQGGDV